MTRTEFTTQLASISARAARVSEMIRARGIKAYNQAFGWHGSEFNGCILHNASIDVAENGKGWNLSVVDRSALRLAKRLMDEKAFEPSRLVDAWSRRNIRNLDWSA